MTYIPTVSIAFRLFSGFLLDMKSAIETILERESQSPFGFSPVSYTVLPAGWYSVMVEKGLNRLSAFLRFPTEHGGVFLFDEIDAVSIAFRLFSGFLLNEYVTKKDMPE